MTDYIHEIAFRTAIMQVFRQKGEIRQKARLNENNSLLLTLNVLTIVTDTQRCNDVRRYDHDPTDEPRHVSGKRCPL